MRPVIVHVDKGYSGVRRTSLDALPSPQDLLEKWTSMIGEDEVRRTSTAAVRRWERRRAMQVASFCSFLYNELVPIRQEARTSFVMSKCKINHFRGL